MNFDFGRRLIDYLAIVGARKPTGNSKQAPALLHRYVSALCCIPVKIQKIKLLSRKTIYLLEVTKLICLRCFDIIVLLSYDYCSKVC